MIKCSACGLEKERGIKCRHGLPEGTEPLNRRRLTNGHKPDDRIGITDADKRRMRKALNKLSPIEEQRARYFARGNR